jgi:hypothetical protein
VAADEAVSNKIPNKKSTQKFPPLKKKIFKKLFLGG